MSVFFPKTYHSVAGCPKKVEKNVKRKPNFWQFGAPLSHLRLFRLCFLPFRFLPYVSFPLKNLWFSEVLLKSLILFRTTIDFHKFSLKSWSFLWKTNDLSRFLFKLVIFVWVIQICISECGWTSIKMTPWSQFVLTVHLRRKVKYWKCHSPSALHVPEIQGSRSETFRLHRFSFTSDSLSPNSLQGVAMLTSIYTKGFHGLQATSCRLQARGGRLQAAGNRLQARSNSKPGATSSRQQATG